MRKHAICYTVPYCLPVGLVDAAAYQVCPCHGWAFDGQRDDL